MVLYNSNIGKYEELNEMGFVYENKTINVRFWTDSKKIAVLDSF